MYQQIELTDEDLIYCKLIGITEHQYWRRLLMESIMKSTEERRLQDENDK